MVGDRIVAAPAGTVVFAPRGVPHTFKIKSLATPEPITIATPAGFEEWFRTLGTPAANFDLPDHVDPPSDAELRQMIALGRGLETETLREVDF